MSNDATPAAQDGFKKPSPMGRDRDLEVMSGNNTVVGEFSAHAAAENAIQQLRKSGYDITKLSIVIEDYRIEERVVGFYTTDDRIKCWGKIGLLWGGTLGLLFGTTLFVFPEIGPGPLAGTLPFWINGAFWGAVTIGGLSAIIAGLYGVSLPKDSVLKYELEMETDSQCILVARNENEAAAAREIIWAARTSGLDDHSSGSVRECGVAPVGQVAIAGSNYGNRGHENTLTRASLALSARNGVTAGAPRRISRFDDNQ